MIEQLMIFFAQNGIYLIIIISLINAMISFKNEAKSLIALVLSLAIAYAISSLVYVPRPFVSGNYQPIAPHAPNSSFPSHHATAGFALSVSTFNTNTILGLISSLIAVIMVIGRIYVGWHSKIDIYAGLFIGSVCSIIAYSKFVDNIIRKVIKKFGHRKSKK
jgi:undecaprenyl-diphosphatase